MPKIELMIRLNRFKNLFGVDHVNELNRDQLEFLKKYVKENELFD